MTLYIDVLFAINFSMDFLSLYLTSVILHKRLYKSRILISSLIGALYGVIEIIININVVLGAIINLAISIIMCVITFKKSSFGRLLVSLILFWGASASLGGIMTLLYNFINKIFYEFIEEYSYTEIYSGARFFIIASLSLLIALIISRIYSSKKDVKEVEACVIYKKEIYKSKGICDSGNLLKEPISGKCVILVSKNSLLGTAIENEQEIKKKYIPYSVVNGEGILKGIVPDKIIINNNEVTAIVATIDNSNFREYDMIVPSSLI